MSHDDQYGSVGEDLYNRGPAAGAAGISREVPREAPRIGYRRPINTRLVRYDRVEARSSQPVPWRVDKLDRMSVEEAGDVMEQLYEIYKLRAEQPSVLEAFHCALYYAYTINGGSEVQPGGRGNITLDGNSMPYNLFLNHLGPNLRRFGRAYADEIRENNKRILQGATDTYDHEVQEKAEMIRQVAALRGLQRYPDLAHDSADCCWQLTDGERAALEASKGVIFANTTNMVDRIRYRNGGTRDVGGYGNMNDGPTARSKELAAAY